MNIISVDASTSYNVVIGHDSIQKAGNYISDICKVGKAAIISDSNVFPLYGKILQDSISASGYDVYSYIFPAGEQSKNGQTYLSILNFLAENTFTRSDVIIALGGGVVGDITGFVAATFLRGVAFIQIPTTLLAMVDSSVGGKTAIDLPAGKNLAGAFYQPKLVICDLQTLNTLPEQIFCDGCAEVLKYGVLYDTMLFKHLSEKGIHFDREYVISQCIMHKANVVKADEFDQSARQMLNLGHTIGHGIEAKSNFVISHGQAVAAGMAIVANAAWHNGMCDHSVYDAICKALTNLKLPSTTTFSTEELYISTLSDKKRSGDTINLIIPLEIGRCKILKTNINDLKSFIEAGL